MTRRSYEQYCPVAAGLDRLGDRWTLLILRDLVWYGPARYGDLVGHNRGLPTALLADRLAALQRHGIVEKDRGDRSYRLTSAGAPIREVIDAIARFGMTFLAGDEVTLARLDYLARRLTSVHARRLAVVDASASIGVDLGGRAFVFDISREGIRLREAGAADAWIPTDEPGLLRLLTGAAGLDEHRIIGDRAVAESRIEFLRPLAA